MYTRVLKVACINVSHPCFLTPIVDLINVNLNNNYELAYTAKVYVGSDRKDAEVVFDTGSGWLTVSKSTCDTCTRPLYDPLTSSTAVINSTESKVLSVSVNNY